MNPEALNWTRLDWAKFQQLSIYFAQAEYPHVRFEEYLKQGHKQDGIDLISTTQPTKYIAIQCKCVDRLTVTSLNELVKEFVDGFFLDKASTFILATTADLQVPKLQRHLQSQRIELENSGVDFVVWDRSYLSAQLKNLYTLVATYFSNEEAEKHCLPRVSIAAFESLGNAYIPRQVYPIDGRGNDAFWRWRFHRDDALSVTSILNADRLKTKRICVVGDPYQGKTYMLKETAYELVELGEGFTPIWITMKSYVVKPIDEILQIQAGTWKQTPASDIVVFLDGLDEVATDQFVNVIDEINAFVTRYPFITIVLSCRKLFYNHYHLNSALRDFDTYELQTLREQDVAEYLQSTLDKRYERFIGEIDRLDLRSVLYDPFYLAQFVQEYTALPYKIPRTRREAVDRFLTKSIEESRPRKLSSGKKFHEQSFSYQLCIQKLAFALQCMGLNTLSDSVVQRLFKFEEIELLKHSPLLTAANGQWSFTSALFQEFLSARVLLALPTDDVIQLVTVGKEIRKMKQKWLQTFSTLLGFTDSGSQAEKTYLKLLNEDSIELIFLQTERSKYTQEFRLAAVKTLINRCAERKVRPFLVDGHAIGRFIDQDINATRYLINCLKSPELSDQVKITCCRILANCTLSAENLISLKHVLTKNFANTLTPEYAEHCISLLSGSKFSDLSFITAATKREELNAYYPYRQALYELILSCNEVDRFYYYGIEGFAHLVTYNKEITHSYSEVSLINFLTSARSAANLKSLYKLAASHEWITFFEHHSHARTDFMNRLSIQTVEVFETYPLIILSLIDFIRRVDLHSMDEELPDLDNLIDRTGSRGIIIGALHEELFNGNGWRYGNLLSDEILGYFLYEFGEGEYPASVLRHILHTLRTTPAKEAVYKKLEQIWRDLSAAETSPADEIYWREQNEFEERKRQNDIRYMQSIDAFIEGLTQIFDSRGQIDATELYIDSKDRSDVRNDAASNLIDSFLFKRVRIDKVLLKDCLKWLENPDAYPYFVVKELLHRDFSRSEEEPIVREIIHSYYMNGLKSANFENACRYKDKQTWTYLRKEKLLVEIFEKFQFPTAAETLMKFVWMDTGGVTTRFQELGNSKKSIAEIVFNNLNPSDRSLFRDEVIANMRSGIIHEGVFGTHVSLCVHLQIEEASPIVLDKLKELKRAKDKWGMARYIGAYVKLNGNLEALKPFLKAELSDDHYNTFFSLVDHLRNTAPALVEKRLLQLFQLVDLPEAYKRQTALKLAEMGNKSAFEYLVEVMAESKLSPTESPDRHPITLLDTKFALQEMMKVRHLFLDDTSGKKFWEEARGTLVEWISQLAGKSERDLIEVLAFYAQAEKDFAMNPKASNFFYYAERCKEKFKEGGDYITDVTTFESLFKKARPKLAS